MKKEELPSLAARFAVLSQRTAKKSTSKKPLHLLFPQTPTTIHSPSSSSSSSRLSSPPSPPHQGASNCQQLLSRLSVRPLGVLPNTTQLFCHDRSALTFRRRCSDSPPNQSTRLPGKNKTSPNEIKCSKYTEGPPSCCLTRFCFIMLQRFNQERRTSSVLLL